MIEDNNNVIVTNNDTDQPRTNQKLPYSLENLPSEVQLNNKRSRIDLDDGLVVASKTTSRVKGDRIQKIFQEIQKQDDAPKIEKKQHLAPVITKKLSHLHEKKTIHANVSEKAAHRIASLMDKYKFANNSRFMEPAEKIRCDLKQRLVNVFLYGIEQLRETSLELKPEQQVLIQEPDTKELEFARKLALEIQIQLLKHHNKSLKGKIDKPYRQRATAVLNNLKDDGNFDLRRKVINGTMSPAELATVKEIELYTQAKREEILSKSRSLMAQNTVQVRDIAVQEQMITLDKIKDQKEQIKAVQVNKSKYMDQKLTDELWDLVGDKQLNKFFQRLKSDLPQKQACLLIENLNYTCGSNFAY